MSSTFVQIAAIDLDIDRMETLHNEIMHFNRRTANILTPPIIVSETSAHIGSNEKHCLFCSGDPPEFQVGLPLQNKHSFALQPMFTNVSEAQVRGVKILAVLRLQ